MRVRKIVLVHCFLSIIALALILSPLEPQAGPNITETPQIKKRPYIVSFWKDQNDSIRTTLILGKK